MTETRELTDLAGVDERTASELRLAGYETTAELRAADLEDLVAVDGVSRPLASRIKSEVRDEDVKEGENGDGGRDVAADVAASLGVQMDETGSEPTQDAESAVYCRYCGTRIPRTAAQCFECDSEQPGQGDARFRRSPAIAGFLSLLVLGTGQLYNHQIQRAIGVVAVGILVGVVLLRVERALMFVVPIGAAIDAYLQANYINARLDQR